MDHAYVAITSTHTKAVIVYALTFQDASIIAVNSWVPVIFRLINKQVIVLNI